MNIKECIMTQRSIRRSKPERVEQSLSEYLISAASYSPSWENSQITSYITVEGPSVLDTIATHFTPESNSKIVKQSLLLIAATFVKGICGFECDGSFTTEKEEHWLA